MRCKVIKSYTSAFPKPLILKKGEKLRIGNKNSEWTIWIWCITAKGDKGWVPENYLKIYNDIADLLEDYNATELSAVKGQIFQVEKEESGWV
jgi:hypothetical protein